nr:hypothetical protein [Tanacetum cinerariifolium]
MRYQALKIKPITEAQERKNMMIYLKNMAGFKMDFFRGMTYTEIRPIFQKHYTSIKAFLEKGEKEIEEERSKRKSESLEQKAAKKQRIDEEVEELKTHLQIIADDNDDVFTEATPLAIKVPVVDYQIHNEDNKPYYKIIRADVTHKLFLSFITILKTLTEKIWRLCLIMSAGDSTLCAVPTFLNLFNPEGEGGVGSADISLAASSSFIAATTLSCTCCGTNIPSNKGVSTPKNPLPTLLIFVNTFCVRERDVYLVMRGKISNLSIEHELQES